MTRKFCVRDSAIDATQRSIDYGSYILFALLISLAVLYWQPKSRIEPSRDSGLSVPWSIPLALFAFGLMTALAVVSTTEYSVHPDEFSHITAARYYVHNWLPPKVGDPESLASYSGYGASYLNEFDVVYFFAARFSAMIGPIFGTNDVILLRFFALLLFIPVIAILFSKSSKAWIAVPVLIRRSVGTYTATSMPIPSR